MGKDYIFMLLMSQTYYLECFYNSISENQQVYPW